MLITETEYIYIKYSTAYYISYFYFSFPKCYTNGFFFQFDTRHNPPSAYIV